MTLGCEDTTRIEHITSQLFQSFISGNNLDSIIELAASLLDNPIIVIDLSYKILSYSDKNKITDRIWLENLKKGYCPYEFIAKVNALQSVIEGKQTESPYCVPCPESNNEKLIYRMKIDKKHIGNVILIGCTSPLKEIDYELISIVGKIVGLKFNNSVYHKSSKEIVRDNFIYDLLEHKYKSKDELTEHMKIADISLPCSLYILEFDISHYKGDEDSDNLKNRLQSSYSIFYSIYYNDAIVAICDKNLLKKYCSRINKHLAEDNIFLGVSREFSDIFGCRKYYFQAHDAISIGRLMHPERNIIYYHDIQFYNLLPSSKSVKNPLDYCHPSLMTLLEYDKKHNSNLYDTLYTYIINDGNIQKTASDLYLHRNTIRYKINKIIELTNIDFSRIEEISNIFVSYRVLRFYELSAGS